MLLSELLGAVAHRPAFHEVTVRLDDDVELTRAAHDSRRVPPGALFCCVPGANVDGHDLAADAVRAGAVALLCERPLSLGVPEVQVASVRAAMGPVAATLAGDPSEKLLVVGVTGTNGKTTTVHLLASILEAADLPAGVIGTLTGTRTTPEAPELQDRLSELAAAGKKAVAMEVSSHALDLHRVDGTRFRVAVFTNLSRDHLDHHADMAAYFAAKALLFEPTLSDLAVVNVEDPHGRLLLDAANVPSVGFSLDEAEDLVLTAEGSTFRWRGVPVRIGLAGRFNVANALAAATAAEALGIAPQAIADGLAAAGPVPGRFEVVAEGQPYLAAVDFAHTPDGLEQLLVAARELAGGGRVLLVFGAGGDRDRSKRPHMGEVAARLADVVVVTTDNPRHEDPAAIIDDVERGMEDPDDLRTEPDRRRAIGVAVAEARPGDVLVVAGKGHETTQTIGDDVVPFDDRAVLRDAIRASGVAS
jgi:UDP-N-acetylmuramoyl-L-alanyl-D-glutamate--2,6-diaminopimelate ligase